MKAGASLVLTTTDPVEAARQSAGAARAAPGTGAPSLAVLFASPHFLDSAEVLVATVAEELGPVPLIGCVGEAVIGGTHEVESGPAVSLWLASDVGPVETFEMDFMRTSTGGAFSGYRFQPGASGIHLMIGDPFTFPAEELLAHLNAHVPGAVVLGGMASGGLQHGQSRLFLDDRAVSHGAVGAYLPQGEIQTLVSQGCRPIGNPYTITQAADNVIHQLGGLPPLTRLQKIALALPDRDRELLAQGLHVGKVINEHQVEWHQGDFLIRGVVGIDPESGAIAVGDEVEIGETLQFHVRDAESADEDLRRTLERGQTGLGDRPAGGALLFTCNGRGSRLFSKPDHDASLVAKMLGDIPVAGFFCAGELGPVGGRNFLHSFTASIALFPQQMS
jgi:small ligand-binding sensory domain FIST